MKYSYFAPGKAGKYLIREMFWSNKKTHCVFCGGHPPIYAVMSVPAGKSFYFDWYWEDDNTGELVHTTHTEHNNIILDTTYMETWYPKSTNGRYSIKELLKPKNKEVTGISASSTCTGDFYKCFKHAFDMDIVVNPLVMLGYGGVLGTDKLNKLLRSHQPNLVNIPTEYVVDELCKRKNIVTHKENIRELARNFFIGNGHLPYKDPNVLCTDTEEKYVQQVTKIINSNRQFEKDIITCLDYYNIPYEIFNLDKDDYAQRFNLDKTFTKEQDSLQSLFDFIEPCDIIEGWIDNYVKENP
tara:strand:+ start:2625 stop:3518 length:894 start_codon:yes stop_codon:yes gene_type:complete